MILKILTDRSNYKKEIDELRQEWLGDLFLYLGAEIDYIEELSNNDKIEYFLQNNIEMVYYSSIDGMEVYYQRELVGEWGGPEFKLKIDKDNEYYFEVSIECWTIQEEEILQ